MQRRIWIPLACALALGLSYVLRARHDIAPAEGPGVPLARGAENPRGERLDLTAETARARQEGRETALASNRGPDRVRVVDHAGGEALSDATLSLLRTAQFDRSHPDERRLYSLRPLTENYPNLAVLDEVVVARSDAEGWVEIAGLADGRYLARHAGYALQYLTLRRDLFEDGAEQPRIELFRSVALATHTKDAEGIPMPGVFFGLGCNDADSPLRFSIAGLDQEPMLLGSARGMAGPSDDQGFARIEGVPCAREYGLFAASGARGGLPRVVVPCGSDLEVQLSLTATGMIHGRILGEGFPTNVPGSVRATTRGQIIPRSSRFLADGSFELAGIPAGRVRVLLERTGLAAFEIDLAPGEVRDLGTIECPERIRISGQVLACPGEPITGLCVVLQDLLGGWPEYEQLDAEGKFSLGAPKVAHRIALVRRVGNGTQILLEQSLERYEDILLDARGSCATLRIACEGLADGASVHAQLLEPEDPAANRLHRERRPAELGRFTVTGGELRIPVGARGTFELYLTSETTIGAWVREVVIAGGGEIELGTLSFGSATLVTWTPGEAPPLPGAIVARSPVFGTHPISLTGNNSTQIETMLPPGRWVLGAGDASEACATEQALELAVGERRTIECRLGTGGAIRGSLRTQDAPCADEVVKLFNPERRSRPIELRTDAEGRFAFEKLREGSWVLACGAQGEGPSLHVELGCGEERQVAILLRTPEVPLRFTRSGEVLPIARAVAVDLDPQSESFGCEREGKRGSDGRWLVQLSGRRVLLRAVDSWQFPRNYAWIGDADGLRRTGTAELARGRIDVELPQVAELAQRPTLHLVSTSDGVDLSHLCPEPLADEVSGPGKQSFPGIPAGVKLLLTGRAPDGALSMRELEAPAGGVLKLVWP